MSKLLLDLAEELDADEDVFVSLLLLDLASEEEGFTEELDSFAFSTEELEFLEPLEDEDWRSPLEAGKTEDEESPAGSGETEEESSPQPAKNNNAANTDNAKIFFIKPPNFIFSEI